MPLLVWQESLEQPELGGAQEDKYKELTTVQVLSFLCRAPKAMCVFASWAHCVHMMRMFWCLTAFCCAPSIYTTTKWSPAGGNFPVCYQRQTQQTELCLGAGPLLLLTTTYSIKGEQDLLPRKKGSSEKPWLSEEIWGGIFRFAFPWLRPSPLHVLIISRGLEWYYLSHYSEAW